MGILLGQDRGRALWLESCRTKRIFCSSMELRNLLLAVLSAVAFSLLGRMSFFTVGEDEVKAWVIPQRPKLLSRRLPFTTILSVDSQAEINVL